MSEEFAPPYDTLDKMQTEFLITHKLGPGEANYMWLTAIMQFPNSAALPDVDGAKRLLVGDIQHARQVGVPKELLEATIKLALTCRELLVDKGIRTGSLSRGDFV